MESLIVKERYKKTANSANRTRREGKVPGVLYGKHTNNFMFETAELELNSIVGDVGEHGIMNIDVNGETHEVLIKEVQRQPVNHKIIHIDLEEIEKGDTVITEIPVKFVGEHFVTKNGGILQKEKTTVKVSCKADVIPKNITIDVSKLKSGSSYKISDIEFGQEISIIDSLNSVIVLVTDYNNYDAVDGEVGIEE